MTLLGSDPPESDLTTVLARIQHWAERYYDDSSPVQVAEVLVVSAFLVGLNMGWANPAQAAGLLRETAVEMPSASSYARALADALAGPTPAAAQDDLSASGEPPAPCPAIGSTMPPLSLN
jgi:hypothetical protein